MRRLPASLVDRLGSWMLGMPLGMTIFGAGEFMLQFPEPLPSFMREVNESKAVTDMLGKPISHSLFWSGKTTRSQAVVRVPVSGPSGSGVLHGRALRPPAVDGEPRPPWAYVALDVEVGDRVVSILDEHAPPLPPDGSHSHASMWNHGQPGGQGPGTLR